MVEVCGVLIVKSSFQLHRAHAEVMPLWHRARCSVGADAQEVGGFGRVQSWGRVMTLTRFMVPPRG